MLAFISLFLSVYLTTLSVTAQSSDCTGVAAALAGAPVGQCLDASGLGTLFSASGSVVDPLTDYLKTICTTDPCEDGEISSADSSVETGCASDISSGNEVALVLSTVLKQYKLVRNTLCLQSDEDKAFCLPTFLKAIETATGHPIEIDDLGKFLTGDADFLQQGLSAVPGTPYCTDCFHAFITGLAKILATTPEGDDSVLAVISSKCGDDFVDGRIPAGIVVTAPGGSTPARKTRRTTNWAQRW